MKSVIHKHGVPQLVKFEIVGFKTSKKLDTPYVVMEFLMTNFAMMETSIMETDVQNYVQLKQIGNVQLIKIME